MTQLSIYKKQDENVASEPTAKSDQAHAPLRSACTTGPKPTLRQNTVAENWIKSYLSGRNQFVKLGECSSDEIQISCGVPQGSVLGPKLFILYINDICNVSKLLKFILFADDTNILYSDIQTYTI